MSLRSTYFYAISQQRSKQLVTAELHCRSTYFYAISQQRSKQLVTAELHCRSTPTLPRESVKNAKCSFAMLPAGYRLSRPGLEAAGLLIRCIWQAEICRTHPHCPSALSVSQHTWQATAAAIFTRCSRASLLNISLFLYLITRYFHLSQWCHLVVLW